MNTPIIVNGSSFKNQNHISDKKHLHLQSLLISVSVHEYTIKYFHCTSEMVKHIAAGQFAQKQVAGIVYRNICAVYGLQNSESQWNTCPKVVMNDRAEIHWDFEFQLTSSRLTTLWLTNQK